MADKYPGEVDSSNNSCLDPEPKQDEPTQAKELASGDIEANPRLEEPEKGASYDYTHNMTDEVMRAMVNEMIRRGMHIPDLVSHPSGEQSESKSDSDEDDCSSGDEVDSSSYTTDEDFRIMVRDIIRNGCKPYQFEPLASGSSIESIDISDYEYESEKENETEDAEEDPRLGTDLWCSCGHCIPMDTLEESICCNEIPRVNEMLESEGCCTNCITFHPGFYSVCLVPCVIDIAFLNYLESCETMMIKPAIKLYRHISYQSFNYFVQQTLKTRYTIPSCAVAAIREQWGDTDIDSRLVLKYPNVKEMSHFESQD